MACCIFGAFLMSQLAIVWKLANRLTRRISLFLAATGVVLVAIGLVGPESPTHQIMMRICGEAGVSMVRLPIAPSPI